MKDFKPYECSVLDKEDALLTRCALLAALLRDLWFNTHRERHEGHWESCSDEPCARIRHRLHHAGVPT